MLREHRHLLQNPSSLHSFPAGLPTSPQAVNLSWLTCLTGGLLTVARWEEAFLEVSFVHGRFTFFPAASLGSGLWQGEIREAVKGSALATQLTQDSSKGCPCPWL